MYSALVLAMKRGLQKKRAGASHSPHPKATCPHPTRPLRPPGRRTHRDYAIVRLNFQPAYCFCPAQLSSVARTTIVQELRTLFNFNLSCLQHLLHLFAGPTLLLLHRFDPDLRRPRRAAKRSHRACRECKESQSSRNRSARSLLRREPAPKQTSSFFYGDDRRLVSFDSFV